MKSALYIRVSTHFQIDKDSLPFQKETLINYSKHALGINSYVIFEDAGYSGKDTERPAFQDMMNRIRDKEFTHLIVWKIDRVSRNLLDFSKMYDELKKYNVTFVSKNEQFDTSSAMGEAMLKIILVFAELERKLTAERVFHVMLSRAEKGLWNGATVPLGYNWSDKDKFPVVDEKEAYIVKQIYELYLEMNSTTKVARYLNNNHIPTKRNGRWVAKTINDVLRNPFYIGTYRYNTKDQKRRLKNKEEWVVIENNHPGIIDKKLFDKIQIILENNYKGNSQYQRENIHTHIFSGIIYCNKCESKFIAGLDKARKDGYRPSRYYCPKTEDGCSNFIGDVTLLPFILNYLSNFIKLKNNDSRKHSLKIIEKKLLRGDVFSDVIGIDHKSLEDTYILFYKGHLMNEFTRDDSRTNTAEYKEQETLEKEKAKFEKALSRLESLYLYDEEGISEKDFIFKKRDIRQQLDVVNNRLKELKKYSIDTKISGMDWLDNTQYFLLNHELKNSTNINYRNILDIIDLELIQDFIKSLIKDICVENKKIMSITFINGLTHRFAYVEKMKNTREHLLYKKYENDLLELITEKKQITRTDIEDLTRLSRSSVIKLLNEFTDRGIIIKVGNSVSTHYVLANSKYTLDIDK